MSKTDWFFHNEEDCVCSLVPRCLENVTKTRGVHYYKYVTQKRQHIVVEVYVLLIRCNVFFPSLFYFGYHFFFERSIDCELVAGWLMLASIIKPI